MNRLFIRLGGNELFQHMLQEMGGEIEFLGPR